MSDTDESHTGPRGLGRPLWWWFLLHGALIAVWGAFALISPFPGAAGWIIDGIGYGIVLVVAGVQLALQGWLGHRHGRGVLAFCVGGMLGVLVGVGLIVAGALGSATAIFWIVVPFLLVEGVLLIVGTVLDPVHRLWGLLMGGILLLALVVLVTVNVVFGGDYDVLDPVLGAFGLLYGIAVILAAIQVRDSGITQDSAVD